MCSHRQKVQLAINEALRRVTRVSLTSMDRSKMYLLIDYIYCFIFRKALYFTTSIGFVNRSIERVEK